MLIFSVSFQFYRMISEENPVNVLGAWRCAGFKRRRRRAAAAAAAEGASSVVWQKRSAWPLRKDDTHKSRRVTKFFSPRELLFMIFGGFRHELHLQMILELFAHPATLHCCAPLEHPCTSSSSLSLRPVFGAKAIFLGFSSEIIR